MVSFLAGVLLGGMPDGKAECNLVDDIRDVVHQAEGICPDLALQVSEEVTQRVDAPAGGEKDTHGLKRLPHVGVDLVGGVSDIAGFTC